MVFFPPAKINIGLHILRKRDDGYHDLELSFLEVPFLHDVLEISQTETDEFLCEGIPVAGKDEDNLVCKAMQALSGAKGKERPACRLHLAFMSFFPSMSRCSGNWDSILSYLLSLHGTSISTGRLQFLQTLYASRQSLCMDMCSIW